MVDSQGQDLPPPLMIEPMILQERGVFADMPTVGVVAAVLDDEHRILCVRRNYGDYAWTLPGGGMEGGETPFEALEREVREETGYNVTPTSLVGVYSMPWKDNLVLCFRATIIDHGHWEPDGEIAEIGFFEPGSLPEPFSGLARRRVSDLFDGQVPQVHVLYPD